jgi:VIT1/CCC1 family predicted Fe2+/Mn2+ transporter
VLLILGLANLAADGFSMALSNYSGTKTEVDEFARLKAVEQRHIAIDPEGEKEEIRQILASKGLRGATLEGAVQSISQDKSAWIDLMMVDEYGLSKAQRKPWLSGASTFLSFLLCGSVPLAPYLLAAENPFRWAAALTCGVFFLIGAAKSFWSLASWWRSGVETLFIGALAATIAFAVGHSVSNLMGVT